MLLIVPGITVYYLAQICPARSKHVRPCLKIHGAWAMGHLNWEHLFSISFDSLKLLLGM